MTKPACFETDEQWAEWVEQARQVGEYCSYCSDCTPEYKDRMMREGRCSHPDVKFYQELEIDERPSGPFYNIQIIGLRSNEYVEAGFRRGYRYHRIRRKNEGK